MASSIADFYRGDTRVYKFDFGTGVDITGWKIYVTMKDDDADADDAAVLQVSNTAGDNVGDDLPNGIMYLTLTSDDTAVLVPESKYFYGFQRIIAGSPPDIKTLLTGKVKILQDITLVTV